MTSDKVEILHEIYEEFYSVSEELEDTVNSFELLYEDIRTALDDINDELEGIRDHLHKCSRTFRMFSSHSDAENRPSGTGRVASP